MQHETGPGASRERENNQELTQDDIELRDSIFDDEDSMAALRKVRPTMSLEDFNKLNHDQLNELAGDIAKRLEAEKVHKEFLETVHNYDFVLVSQAAQELGMDVRTVNQLNELDDFSIARISDVLIRKYGRNGERASGAGAGAGTTGLSYDQGPFTYGGTTEPIDASQLEMYKQRQAEELARAEKDVRDVRERQAEEMARAQKDVEDLFKNADSGERSEAEKNFRKNMIANLHINDAWLRERAGVDPSSLSRMSTVDLGKLFDRFTDEKGASYVSESDRAKKEAAKKEQAGDEQTGEKSGDTAEKREKKKKSRMGMRVAAAVAALGLLGGGLFGVFASRKTQKANAQTETTAATTMDSEDLGITTSEDAIRELTGDTAEEDEGIWSAADGNDARGLFADENDPTKVNPDKLGEHNLVDDEEFANEDLSTEEGTKKFKEHFIKVNERQAVNMAMFADYMQQHGGDKYIPDSLKGLSGEALENAIVENKDGCYDDLCKSYEDFINNAKVRKGSLKAGKYTNYYAKQINPDQIMTKDNIELYSTTTFEKDGTPVFVFETDDGLVYTVKQGCAQAILEITGNPVNPPTETTTPPPSETTPPPTETTTPPPDTTTPPPTETTTPPPDTTTPPPTETTTPPPSYDDSKKEEDLAAGQGGNVTPTEAGAREAENHDQQDYDPAHNTPETPSAESQAANQDQAGDVNDTAQGAAERQQRQEAAAQQEQINQERNDDQAVQPNYDALNSDNF